jgi:hypothetical protein
LFTTSDNWNIDHIDIHLTSSTGGLPITILNIDPHVRLMDNGNNTPWTVVWALPGSVACGVACLSGHTCATQSDCTSGTCVGGTGVAGSGCCTETYNQCGCNSDCPTGETCVCPSNDTAPCMLGTCGATLAGTCQ